MSSERFKTHVRNWRNWAILALAILLVASQFKKPATPDRVRDTRDSTISAQKKKIAVLELRDKDKEAQIKADSLKGLETQKNYIRRAQALQAELIRARADVQALADSTPVLQKFMEVTDSMMVLKDNRIAELESEKSFQRGLYRDLVSIKVDASAAKDVIIANQSLIIADQDKTIKKRGRLLKVLKNVAKYGIPAAFIGGVIVGNQ